ncbi:MAG: OmpA family protein [Cytophagales bacterium]
MIFNRLILVFGFIVIFSCASFSQKVGYRSMLKQRIADKAFSRLQYAEASILYEELMKTENSGRENKAKLAMCYYKMNDTKRAENIYRQLYDGYARDTASLYNFADVLAKNGRYEEAKMVFKEYIAQKPDQRADMQLESIAQLGNLYADSSRFRIFYFLNNTSESDFSPTPYKKGVVFSSNRTKDVGTRRIYGWDNSAYLDLYYSDTTGLDTLKFKTDIGIDLKDTTSYADIENKGMLHPDEATRTSNDTRRLGYHGVFLRPDSLWNTPDSLRNAVKFNKTVNTKYHEGPSCFVGDTLIYFTRNNYNGWGAKKSEDKSTNLNIYISRLRNGNWTRAELLPFCNKNYSVGHPAISRDGKTLYFASNMPGGKGKTDLYKTTIEAGKWSTPENLGAPINTAGDELFPFVDSLNVLYFASNGLGGLGGLDIFKADISGNNPKVIKNIGYPVNSKKDDFGLIISNNNKTGFFSSNRKRGISDDDIYFFKQETFKPFQLKVIVKNALDSSFIASAEVSLRESISKISRKDTLSDENASFRYKFIKPIDQTLNYKLLASKREYYDNELELPSTLFAKADGKVIDTVIYLKKILYIDFCASVLYKKSHKPIEGATIFFYDPQMGTVDTAISGKDGKFCRRLQPLSNYVVKAEKENHFPDCYQLSTPAIKTPTYASTDVPLEPVKIGLNTTFELKNLLYDYNKANIREDAGKILDNLVDVLNEYPTIKIELGSHCDSRGNDGYNQKLSQRRADSAVAYIIKHGVSKMRIVAKGYGEFKLLNKCKNNVKCTDEEHQANRRTEVRVTGFLKPSEYAAAGIDKNYQASSHLNFDTSRSYGECGKAELKIMNAFP